MSVGVSLVVFLSGPSAAATVPLPPIAMSTPAATQYVYRQQAPSVVESVLNTILHPGVNPQTYSVLNVTLGALFVVISLMLFLFDAIAARFRLHLWIFLAVCFSLILSVNWFFMRFQLYGNDDDEEEEEAAEEQPKKAIQTSANKKKTAQPVEEEEEEEEEEDVESEEEPAPVKPPARKTKKQQ